GEALQRLGEATGPVRDLDVVLERVRPEVEQLEETDQAAKTLILERLEEEREHGRRRLLEALESRDYRCLLAGLRLPPARGDGLRRGPYRRARARAPRTRAGTAARGLEATAKERIAIDLRRLRLRGSRAAW